MRETLLRALEQGKNGGGASATSGGKLSGAKGLLAGAGAAALVPLAVKSAGRLADALGVDSLEDLMHSPQGALEEFTSRLGDHVGGGIGGKVTDKIDEAGGPGGIIKDALPFGGGNDDDEQKGGGGAPGTGKGRRMPVQQSVDIGAPIETLYNQWTQFEQWPTFMHRVKRVTQEDDCTVSFQTKIWGKSKEFVAKIDTQRPDERIKWRVSQGMTHQGVVTFHELGPNLTRVLLDFDVEPGSLIEKAARGMRHVKRAARADLHRFKAFIEMAEHETGAWRGVIEHGEVVEEHDPGYDEDREYSDIDDLLNASGEDEDEGQDQEQEGEEQEDDDQHQASGGEDEDEQASGRGRARRSGGSSGRSEQPARQRSSSRVAGEGEGAKPRSRSGRSSNGQGAKGRSSNGGSASSTKSSRAGNGKSAASAKSSRSSGGAQSQPKAASSRSRSRDAHGSGGSGKGGARASQSKSGSGGGGRRQTRSRSGHSS